MPFGSKKQRYDAMLTGRISARDKVWLDNRLIEMNISLGEWLRRALKREQAVAAREKRSGIPAGSDI